MNISIGNNIRVSHMNSMMSKPSNTGSSAINSLNKQKDALQNQIKEISENKGLSSSEKTQKLNELQKQMDELDTQIGKQKLEDIKNSGKELAENMAKKTEKSKTNEEEKENGSIALNYSLLSASTDNKDVKKLNWYRKVAIKEDGPASDRVKRIDNMISDKQESIKENLVTMDKAIKMYSESNEKELEEKIKEKNEKHKQHNSNVANQIITEVDNSNTISTSEKTSDSDITNQEIDNYIKVDTVSTRDNIKKININNNDTSELLDVQAESKKARTQHSINIRV